jgi:hypothetical protein
MRGTDVQIRRGVHRQQVVHIEISEPEELPGLSSVRDRLIEEMNPPEPIPLIEARN